MLSRATALLTVALMGSEPFCFMAFMVRMTGSGQHGARHVADEACGAHGHVSGVAGEGQKRHSEADQHADQGQALFAIEEIQGSPFYI